MLKRAWLWLDNFGNALKKSFLMQGLILNIKAKGARLLAKATPLFLQRTGTSLAQKVKAVDNRLQKARLKTIGTTDPVADSALRFKDNPQYSEKAKTEYTKNLKLYGGKVPTAYDERWNNLSGFEKWLNPELKHEALTVLPESYVVLQARGRLRDFIIKQLYDRHKQLYPKASEDERSAAVSEKMRQLQLNDAYIRHMHAVSRVAKQQYGMRLGNKINETVLGAPRLNLLALILDDQYLRIADRDRTRGFSSLPAELAMPFTKGMVKSFIPGLNVPWVALSLGAADEAGREHLDDKLLSEYRKNPSWLTYLKIKDARLKNRLQGNFWNPSSSIDYANMFTYKNRSELRGGNARNFFPVSAIPTLPMNKVMDMSSVLANTEDNPNLLNAATQARFFDTATGYNADTPSLRAAGYAVPTAVTSFIPNIPLVGPVVNTAAYMGVDAATNYLSDKYGIHPQLWLMQSPSNTSNGIPLFQHIEQTYRALLKRLSDGIKERKRQGQDTADMLMMLVQLKQSLKKRLDSLFDPTGIYRKGVSVPLYPEDVNTPLKTTLTAMLAAKNAEANRPLTKLQFDATKLWTVHGINFDKAKGTWIEDVPIVGDYVKNTPLRSSILPMIENKSLQAFRSAISNLVSMDPLHNKNLDPSVVYGQLLNALGAGYINWDPSKLFLNYSTRDILTLNKNLKAANVRTQKYHPDFNLANFPKAQLFINNVSSIAGKQFVNAAKQLLQTINSTDLFFTWVDPVLLAAKGSDTTGSPLLKNLMVNLISQKSKLLLKKLPLRFFLYMSRLADVKGYPKLALFLNNPVATWGLLGIILLLGVGGIAAMSGRNLQLQQMGLTPQLLAQLQINALPQYRYQG